MAPAAPVAATPPIIALALIFLLLCAASLPRILASTCNTVHLGGPLEHRSPVAGFSEPSYWVITIFAIAAVRGGKVWRGDTQMHWKLRLECSDCGARITFEDEKPEWASSSSDERYILCPACGGRAEATPHPRLDLGLNKAFSAFRTRASR